MRVARDEMRQPELEQPERGPARGAAEASVERGGCDLDERALFDHGTQAIGGGLHLSVPFRMRQSDPMRPAPATTTAQR